MNRAFLGPSPRIPLVKALDGGASRLTWLAYLETTAVSRSRDRTSDISRTPYHLGDLNCLSLIDYLRRNREYLWSQVFYLDFRQSLKQGHNQLERADYYFSYLYIKYFKASDHHGHNRLNAVIPNGLPSKRPQLEFSLDVVFSYDWRV